MIDDIDYLDKNSFFSKNKDVLFSIEDESYNYGQNFDSDDDDHISLDSMGKVKPKNNTRNRRSKIKIIHGGSSGCDNSEISETQYIIHDDFNNISNELNAVVAILVTFAAYTYISKDN